MVGWRFKSKGTRVYLWPVPADVWQRPSRYYKAIIFQLKKKKPRVWGGSGFWPPRWAPGSWLGKGMQPRGSRLYCGACVTGDEQPASRRLRLPVTLSDRNTQSRGWRPLSQLCTWRQTGHHRAVESPRSLAQGQERGHCAQPSGAAP